MRGANERGGQRVAQADVLIAATALIDGLVLVTPKTRDFERCGVALFNPFSRLPDASRLNRTD